MACRSRDLSGWSHARQSGKRAITRQGHEMLVRGRTLRVVGAFLSPYAIVIWTGILSAGHAPLDPRLTNRKTCSTRQQPREISAVTGSERGNISLECGKVRVVSMAFGAEGCVQPRTPTTSTAPPAHPSRNELNERGTRIASCERRGGHDRASQWEREPRAVELPLDFVSEAVGVSSGQQLDPRAVRPDTRGSANGERAGLPRLHVLGACRHTRS